MKFFEALAQTFANKPIDWDELEASFIRADLGVQLTTRIIERLRECEAWSLTGITDVIKLAREEILRILPAKSEPIAAVSAKPKVILIVGVNGTGKTTSTAKLAHYLIKGRPLSPPTGKQSGQLTRSSSSVSAGKEGASVSFDEKTAGIGRGGRDYVLLAAADTFRAAAIEQLGVWAERLGLEMIRGQYGADPAALCYDAYQTAQKRNFEFLICDTAGRVHTKTNLMAELQKIKRTLAKQDPGAPQEILLVIDATTGSNALSQAREFHQALGLTGLIVTKLDGSGKGGIVVAIQDELGIPTRFVGTGEKMEDFKEFDGRDFVANIL